MIPSSPSDEPEVVHLTLTVPQVRRLRTAAIALAVAAVAGVVALGFTVPRSLAYTTLVQENLELKGHLQEVDRKMAEVDRILLRLRLYDAQIESLAEPSGDHGPIDAGSWANHRIAGAAEAGLMDAPLDGETRPAHAWAAGVQARVDTFVSMFERAEPDLSHLVEELEELRALERALPVRWPADGALSSGYGWRKNPLGHTWRFHSGVDVDGDRHDPIYAVAPGVVASARTNEGYGRVIELDHGFGITTLYAHCTRLLVEEGQTVEAGDLIATVGTTGRSTGPHLHFEVRLDGHAVDPLDYLPY